MATFEDKVIIDMPNEVLKRKMEREIGEALTKADPVVQKSRIIGNF